MRALLADSRLRRWFHGDAPPERGTVVLGHRRVYIMPTRAGWIFAATVGILLVGSINYALQLGFALTFLLAGMGLAGMVHTTRNLARLAVSAGRAEPVFAGERAQFHLHLDNRSPFERPSILVRHVAGNAQQVLNLPALAARESVLPVPGAKRGWLRLTRVMLETRFPLGLFRAWSYIELDARCLVYPRPERTPLPAPAADAAAGAARAQAQGSDDFSGLRGYQPSDSPRHVAWKAAARAENMLTKQFSGAAGSELWLDWSLVAGSPADEPRLSRLCGWVLQAEQAGALYGLRLPGLEVAPGRGDAHRSACLQALALYASA